MRCPTLLISFVLALPVVSFGFEFRSSFEDGELKKPEGWTLDDKNMSSISDAESRTGKRSLRIVDIDREQLGSSAYSQAIDIPDGKDVRLMGWCYLESGDRHALGLYIEFLDKDGKRVGERDGFRQSLIQGRWNLMIASHRPPKDAVKARAWIHSLTNAVITCYLDDIVLETIDPEPAVKVVGWEGAYLDPKTRKEWPAGVRWEHDRTPDVDYLFSQPQDWSGYRGFSLNIYSERPTSSTFVLIFASENPATEGADYVRVQLPTNFRGWKQLRYRFSDMVVSRNPVGIQQVDAIKLRATGFSQRLDPNTTIVIDGFALIR